MLTPFEIQEAIETELGRMDGLVSQLGEAVREQAQAETDFKVGYAQARLTIRSEAFESGTKVTIDHADDYATVTTADARYRSNLATNNVMTLREAIRVSQAHIDGLRTLAASHRSVTP
jgi:hypothetical protein